MKRYAFLFILLCLFVSEVEAAAPSLYRYRDATGTTHIVTTLRAVPAAFRAHAKPIGRESFSIQGVVNKGNEKPVSLNATAAGLVVSIRLNDKVEGRALIDTGAEISVISPKLARSLGYGRSDQTMIRIATLGSSVELPLVRLSRLAIGGASVTEVAVAITKIEGPANVIIGLDFLSRFECEIDSGAPSLTLYELRREEPRF